MRERFWCAVIIVCVILCAATRDGGCFSRVVAFSVSRDGAAVGSVRLLKRAGVYYIGARDLARFYRGSPRFYPVTKKILISLYTIPIEIFWDSNQIVIDSTLKTLDHPTVSYKNRWYVPVSLMLAQSFSEVARYNSDIDIRRRTIALARRVSVRKPEVFSYADRTRIVINFDSTLSYRLVREEADRLTYEFTHGYGGKEYELDVDDGVINTVVMHNRLRGAVMHVFLQDGAGGREDYMFHKEHYLVIDIVRTPLASGSASPEARRAQPAHIYIASIAPQPLVSRAPAGAGGDTGEQAKEAGSDEDVPSPAASSGAAADASASAGIGAAIADRVRETRQNIAVAAERIRTAAGKDEDAATIVIDPGHGGRDPGAVGYSGVKEKDLNLAVSKQLVKALRARGYRVLMTRNDDTFVPLYSRANFANRVKADIFVSIHCNASLRKKASGFEIYFLSEKASDPGAKATARLENAVVALEGKPSKRNRRVQELLYSMAKNAFINESSALCGHIRKVVRKGIKMVRYDVKQAGFFVLKGTQMPAVLVELGFISNKHEERQLSRGTFQRKMVAAITKGIHQYEKNRHTDR